MHDTDIALDQLLAKPDVVETQCYKKFVDSHIIGPAIQDDY